MEEVENKNAPQSGEEGGLTFRIRSDAPAGKDAAPTPRTDAHKFTVGGKEVSEEEYFKAAEKSPWDVQFLRENKYYPPL